MLARHMRLPPGRLFHKKRDLAGNRCEFSTNLGGAPDAANGTWLADYANRFNLLKRCRHPTSATLLAYFGDGIKLDLVSRSARERHICSPGFVCDLVSIRGVWNFIAQIVNMDSGLGLAIKSVEDQHPHSRQI